MISRSDSEALRDAQSDPAAFTPLVLRHHAVVHRYVARRLGPGEADDIASEVFATAFASLSRYDHSYPDARPWLLGIATNLMRRHAKREARMLRSFAASGVDPLAPEAPPADAALSAALAGALAAMRPKHRDALFLSAVGELTNAEIAAALGVSVGTVKSWLHRARQSAGKELAARGVLAQPRAQPKAIEQ